MEILGIENYYISSNYSNFILLACSRIENLNWLTTFDINNNDIDNDNRLQYRYSPDVDILVIYFKTIEKGIINSSNEIFEGIIADFDKNGKVVSLEIMSASDILNVHFFNYQFQIESRLPFKLSHIIKNDNESYSYTIKFSDDSNDDLTQFQSQESNYLKCLKFTNSESIIKAIRFLN